MWISPDPKRQHFNPYTYGANSPINRVDPNGLEDVYYLLGNTFSAKHKTTLISDEKFNTTMSVSDQEFRKKGYTTKFGKLSEASLEAALSDPEAKFIYILSHGAGPAKQEHDGKEWVQPADIDVVNTTASVCAAGCYLQDYQQTWWDKISQFFGLHSGQVSSTKALNDISERARYDAVTASEKEPPQQ